MAERKKYCKYRWGKQILADYNVYSKFAADK
jgi:hypothetical protein